jgi:NAD(P)-dependent dehydrogenase (short-subunit alcohol dehydrogenase family)
LIGVQADVSKLADLQKLVSSAVEKFGHVDIMVNNAGVETRTSILDTTEAQYEKVLEINLKSAFFGTQLGGQTDDQAGRRGPNYQHNFHPRRLADARQHTLLPLQRRNAHVDAHGGRGTRSS